MKYKQPFKFIPCLQVACGVGSILQQAMPVLSNTQPIIVCVLGGGGNRVNLPSLKLRVQKGLASLVGKGQRAIKLAWLLSLERVHMSFNRSHAM